MYDNSMQYPGMQYPPTQAPMMAPEQSFARGGRVRKASLTLAHMSPHELHILDHLQGGTERHNKSGVRSYTHLEELLKNPHIRANVHHHAREHHAMGGDAGMSHDQVQHMAHYGRGGDTEMALIGPNTHHLFNAMAGYSTRNPHDGHPEYWSLGGALGGLMKGIKGVGSKVMGGLRAAAPTLGAIGQAAMPALGNIASKHLGNKFGDVGGMLGQLGTGLATSAFGKMAGDGPNHLGTAIGHGLGQFATAKDSGQSTRQAFGQGLSGAGSNMGNDSALGGLLSTAGHGVQNGQGAGDMFKALAPGALMGGMQAASHISNARKSGQSIGNSLRSGLQGAMHSPEAEANQQAFGELPGMYED